MKLTCLSKGRGFHFPPCHVLSLCGFQILLECPIDLSPLAAFSPIPSVAHELRRRTDPPRESDGLIRAVPRYRTVKHLSAYDVSLFDAVLVSSPAGMLGLPFLARHPKFSARIYATEATARLGRLMMEDLLAMHAEFVQFYGPEEDTFPEWMKWDELEVLPSKLKEIIIGENDVEMGNLLPLYSAADVKECMRKFKAVKYCEEICHDGILMIKPVSSGLEIGASNWIIVGPRRNVTYVSSSIFESSHAMGFDYNSLQGNDIIIFSDFSSLGELVHGGKVADMARMSVTDMEEESVHPSPSSISSMRGCNNEEALTRCLTGNDEISEELDKLSFISSCVMNCSREGGSVLIPIGRLGIVLQLLELISMALESLNLKIPIYMISAIAEETLSFTNVVPEWLCKQHQQKLYSGEALFGHVQLKESKKLHLFPVLHSPSLLTNWQEPCIVFSPHNSLRIGPVAHLLQRWHQRENCLLVLEEGVDADLALLPFKPVAMKVLQCSFLSGIKIQKVPPLLQILNPKLVLLPEEMKDHLPTTCSSFFSFSYYSESETLLVPSLQDDFEAHLAKDLALQLKPKRIKGETTAVARLKGQLLISNGKYMLVPSKRPGTSTDKSSLLYCGSVDPTLLVSALAGKEIIGTVSRRDDTGAIFVQVDVPSKALIEIGVHRTVICSANETLCGRICESACSVLDGI
ncbi:hypothetical protein QJS10_CPB04g00376 [Acorus calamus]|uniref:Beta-Casp domain-containing protein n=1 Tax=Acorus calamus TaxID=4465 RepID=A0AAV9F3T8_ACOCL|nr:hypothetical protein QJS10_CPB04g00376 [Acorus calamus]